MRRIIITFAAIAATIVALASCQKEDNTIIDYSLLPAAAQTTINNHFDKDEVLLVIYDKALFDKEYTVTFTDGSIIEFDKNGAWESIQSSAGVPSSIIPDGINTAITKYYPSQTVVDIDKDNDGYDVTLDNGVELEFNTSGSLVGID